MLPTPVVAAAAVQGADRLAVNRLSHAILSRPDRPPQGRWRVPGGMGLRPTLPPAPPARNRRLWNSRQQWPPLACRPGASAADNGTSSTASRRCCSPRFRPPSSPSAAILLHGPRSDHHANPAGVTSHVGRGDAAVGLPHDVEVPVGRIAGPAARTAAEPPTNRSSVLHGHQPDKAGRPGQPDKAGRPGQSEDRRRNAG